MCSNVTLNGGVGLEERCEVERMATEAVAEACWSRYRWSTHRETYPVGLEVETVQPRRRSTKKLTSSYNIGGKGSALPQNPIISRYSEAISMCYVQYLGWTRRSPICRPSNSGLSEGARKCSPRCSRRSRRPNRVLHQLGANKSTM